MDALPPDLPYGARGEVVVTDEVDVGFLWRDRVVDDQTKVAVAFAPAVDWFIVDHVSLGLELDARYRDVRRRSATTLTAVETLDERVAVFGGGPRLAIDVPLGRKASVTARVAGGLEWLHSEKTSTSSPVLAPPGTVVTPSPFASTTTPDSVEPWFSVYVPILVHPRPHFVLGMGPYFYDKLGSKGGSADEAGRTSIGAYAVVGVWWGGHNVESEEGSALPDASPVRKRGFGETGEWVLSGGASFASTTHRTTGVTTTDVMLTPGFDAFVGGGVSLGAFAEVAYASYGSNLDDTVVGAGGRVGIDLSLTDALSLWPKVSFGIFHGSTPDRNEAVVALYVPLLVHVAEHAFIGFGPYANHPFFFGSDDANPRVTLGANVLVGGWL